MFASGFLRTLCRLDRRQLVGCYAALAAALVLLAAPTLADDTITPERYN